MNPVNSNFSIAASASQITGHIKSVCVFCGSRPGNDPVYMEMAEETGRLLAQQGYHVVYGSGTAGLMGAVAKGAREAGGKVFGINVHIFAKLQGNPPEGTDEKFTQTMYERKQEMIERSDAFLVLPGGIGTFDEIGESLVWNDIAKHEDPNAVIKPVILVNHNDFFQGALLQLETSRNAGFTSASIGRYYTAVPSVDNAFGLLDVLNQQGPVKVSSDHTSILLPDFSSQRDKLEIYVP